MSLGVDREMKDKKEKTTTREIWEADRRACKVWKLKQQCTEG